MPGVALITFFGALWLSLSSVASIRRMKRFRSPQNPERLKPSEPGTDRSGISALR